MIEPIDSLAVSMHHSPGVYALILGSGVSRSAGIPTGFEITVNLIREIAASVGEACTPDPVSWYKAKYEEDPDYSNVLENVAKAQPERKAIIQPYFELSPAERENAEEGYKLPTEAHRRIASLVANGYIKVIMTTNFDSLMEQALDYIGVSYQVISTSDGIKGALPLVHSQCTIFKINGDYKDARIKNTVEELSCYETPVQRLLQQITDEYGLIVCGWSADYDIALRNALFQSTPRFASYWIVREKPRDQARPLIEHLGAQVIATPSADSFFQQLEEKVIALKDLSTTEVPTAKMAATTLKRYLPDDKYEIRLHDFVMEHTEQLYDALDNVPQAQYSDEELRKRAKEYEGKCEIMLSIMTVGCYWSKEHQDYLWVKALQRVANSSQDFNGYQVAWIDLRWYPALLLFYAGGLAALAAERYQTLTALFLNPQIKVRNTLDQPIVLAISTDTVLEKGLARRLHDDYDRAYFPMSEHLFKVLREPMRPLVPNDDKYEQLFDTFQYLIALAHADLNEREHPGRFYGPLGRFAYKRPYMPLANVIQKVNAEAAQMRDNWPLVQAGLFNSFARLEDVEAGINDLLSSSFWRAA